MTYIKIENMKLPVVSGFKSTIAKDMWSTHQTYKIKVDVNEEQYNELKSLYVNSLHVLYDTSYHKSHIYSAHKIKEGNISFAQKIDSNFWSGKFDILNFQELSKTKIKRTIQLEVANLEMSKADLETSRDLFLEELFD